MVIHLQTIITREPTPWDQPLPERMLAWPSATFKPDTLLEISSIRITFEVL